MEMEEIVKLLIVVVVLVLMIGLVVVLFKGRGGELLGNLKDFLRLGR
jgi:hypothetical protein